jgi:teichoic acid transport system permease protein
MTDTSSATRVYDAEHRMPPIGPYLADTLSHLQFAYQKALLDRRGAQKDTWFGRLWNILNPMLLGVVYWLLVIVIFKRGGDSGMAVLTQILGGLFLYQLPGASLSLGARSIVGGGSFVLNTRLPRMILPISAVIMAFLNFAPSMAVYALFHVMAGYPFGTHLLWLIPILLLLCVLSVGLGLAIATLNVYFRDVASFLPYVIRVGLYLTPIIYLYNDIPQAFEWALLINPLGGLFASWQQVLFEGIAPSPTFLLAGFGWAVLALVGGIFFFLRRERYFAVRL